MTYKAGYWGIDAEVVTVVGQHRMSKQLIAVDMQRRHLENWRVKAVYSPALISRLVDGHHEQRTADDWQSTADSFNAAIYFYGFERSPGEVHDVVRSLWANQTAADPLDSAALATAQAVAYQDSPDHPVGVGFVSNDRCASTYVAPDLADESRPSCRRVLLVTLGIANQRFGRERQLTHLRIDRSHDDKDEPVRIFSELEPGGSEIRKVECYRDGRCDFAAAGSSSGTTRLATTSMPTIAAINEDPQFSAHAITAQHFERVWVDACAQLPTVA